MKEKDILKIYNSVLKEIEYVLGNDTTYDNDLYKIGKELFNKKFKGVYARNKKPKLKNNECCILNLDYSYQSGSHWISIYCKNQILYIYDSFGRKTNKILEDDIKNYIDSQNDAEQHIMENNCGQRSLSWLWCVYYYDLNNALKI